MSESPTPTRGSADASESSDASLPGSGESHLETMYESIPVSTLVVESVVPVDLFTEIDHSALLYRASGDPFTREIRRTLREQETTSLLIRRADREKYYQYLGGNLRVLLSGPDTSPGEVYDASVMVAGRAMEEPQSKPARDLASTVIGNAIDMTTRPGGILSAIHDGTPGLRYLRAHSMRVCFYGLQLARGVGIDDSGELADLGLGLMLHDLGKIVSQVGEISDPAELQNHPALGLNRIAGIPEIGPVARDVIEHHHERLDGQGRYHLAADEISLHARIAAVANEFDRRTVDLEGRTIQNSFEALRAMIAEEKGAYDPKLLALFVRALSL